MPAPDQQGRVAVRHEPEHQRLVGGPNRDATDERPENIVVQLPVETESAAASFEGAIIKLEPLSLATPSVEVKVQPARYAGHQDQIAHIDFCDPAVTQNPCLLQGRLEVKP